MRIHDLPRVNGTPHPGAAIDDRVLLDVRALARPEHPFTWMICQLEGADYATEAEARRAAELIGWYRWLEQQIPRLGSPHPVMLAALARAAADHAFRKGLVDGLALIEHAINKAADLERRG